MRSFDDRLRRRGPLHVGVKLAARVIVVLKVLQVMRADHVSPSAGGGMYEGACDADVPYFLDSLGGVGT